MKRKGFTLIELLAVIVILAVIALIATPAVLNIIEDSKESAAKDSASVISKAAETYYMSETSLKGNEVTEIDLTKDTLNYKGEKPEKGYVTFDEKGNAYLKMYMNGYCIVSDYDNTVVAEKMTKDECAVTSDMTLELFEDGDEVFYNPVTNDVCVEGTENCMKWYAFLDTEESPTIRLLLDHNVVNGVAWHESYPGSNFDITTRTSLELLDLATEEWTLPARFLRAVEVQEIVKKYSSTVEDYGEYADSFNIADYTTLYYFTTGTKSPYSSEKPHTLGWLYDNLKDCKRYGCNGEDNNASYNYWLEELSNSGKAWSVKRAGSISWDNVGYYDSQGIRPVIEVEKTRLIKGYKEVVIVNTGGGKLIGVTPEYKAGQAFTTLPEVTRRGHTFLGWYDESGNQITTDTIVVRGMTIIAKWQANTYTVTFKNEGTTVKTQTVTYGQPYGTLLAPTKYDHKFLGWRVNKDIITADTIVRTTKNHNAVTSFVEITYVAELYFNPVTNEACSSTEYNATTNSKNGYVGKTGNGCMKWFAYKEDGDNYLMILDHNTTEAGIVWRKAEEELAAIQNNNKYGWHADVVSTTRFISATEVHEIAQANGTANSNWNITDPNTSYLLHTGRTTIYEGYAGTNKYSWLFDNLGACERRGCNVEQSGQTSYWTSDNIDGENIWIVDKDGFLDTGRYNTAGAHGVRPVISVPKSKFTN